MASLESLVADASQSVSALISKPKMTDKLLSKPPFRFLHDIITAVTTTTGFAEGLFQGAELDSAAITEKQAKIDYLDKIINFVGICKGAALDIRSLKVVAGQEPENTNMFLIALAEVASDPSYDSAEALRRTQAGELAGSGPPARKKSESAAPRAEAKDSGSRDDAKPQAGDAKSAPAYEAKLVPSAAAAAAAAEQQSDAGLERGKSRGGTRGGKPPSHSANDVGLSQPAINLDRELERCDGSFALTQTLLTELITKPKLSDKLLSKPPFRFLYDIIMEVSRATGFGAGLFSSEEWDSAAVTSREQKMQYLDKILKLVGVQLNTLVEARSTKIVAGLDAEVTNRFLQYLAVAAKHAPDSRAAVRDVLEQMGLPPNNDDSDAPAKPAAAAAAAAAPSAAAEEKGSSRGASGPSAKGEPAMPSSASAAHHGQQQQQQDAADDKQGGGGDDDDRAGGRPMTARRRPPKVKDGAKVVDKKEAAVVARKAEGIMADGADEVDEEDIPDETRLADDLGLGAGADGKQGAGGGAQSKLVQDILGRQAEAEAARSSYTGAGSGAGSAGAGPDDESKGEGDAGKGGIRLGRLRKTGADKKGGPGGSGSGGTGGSGGSVFSESDIERLRGAIQGLVQHTGPLGSCLDFLQEDVGLMTAELRRWEDDARKFEARADSERQRSEEKLHPLQAEIVAIDEQISEQIAKISSTKANIARNEERVLQLLKLVSSS